MHRKCIGRASGEHRDAAGRPPPGRLSLLPANLAEDRQFLERFDREARSISQLAHLHICRLFDVGNEGDVHFLVLEYLDGETLAARLARGRLTVPDALRIAIEIAAALDHAHRHGIVHRDLKPANIVLAKTTGSSTPIAKLLDFGLAKHAAAVVVADTDTALPTMSAPLTAQGTLLGTFQYMAPEQVEGAEADVRTDIFAFGVVLYEMLTGRRAFEGKSQASLLGAILKDEPAPVSHAQPVSPPALDHLVRTCLAKDPDARFQTARDVQLQLQWIAAGAGSVAGQAAGVVPPKRRERLFWAAAVLGAAVLAGAGAWWFKPAAASETPVVTRFPFLLPEGQYLFNTGRHVIAISPDGTNLAYVANRRLYLRHMNQLDAEPVRGTDDGPPTEPVFSPDGLSLVFFVPVSGAGGDSQPYSVRKVALTGGTAVTLGQTTASPFGVSWRTGLIAFGQNSGGVCAIQAIPDTGGSPRTLATVDCATERAVQPELLDDGAHLLFVVPALLDVGRESASGEGPIVVQAIGSDKTRNVILPRGENPRVLPGGRLVYLYDRTLMMVPFDSKRLVVTGTPTPVLADVAQNGQAAAGQFAISRTGQLAYLPGALYSNLRQLTLVDRDGGEHAIAAVPKNYQQPRLSPEGGRLAVSGNESIWIWSFARETLMQLTSDANRQFNPAWTPDGRVVYDSNSGGALQILGRAADGTGAVDVVMAASAGYPEIVSPDGTFLIFHTPQRIAMRLPLDREGPARPFLETKAQLSDVEISPDRRWVAYESNESSRFEIYVRPFPALESGRTMVSTAGGQHPVWSRDGHELFFIAADGMMMSARVQPVQPGQVFAYDKPVRLFSARPYFVNVARGYDVSPDGKGFVMVKSVLPAGTRQSIIIVSNWFEELRAKLGGGR